MMRLVKRLLGSRWLKWAVAVIVVGIGAYKIDIEWNQVHHALGEIGQPELERHDRGPFVRV